MQEGIAFGIWDPPAEGRGGGKIAKSVSENPVVVVGRRGCFMAYVARRLLQGLGVDPTLCEIGDDEAATAAVVVVEGEFSGCGSQALPAVFVGGRLIGGIDRLMAVHLSGDLVPILRDAGALWL